MKRLSLLFPVIAPFLLAPLFAQEAPDEPPAAESAPISQIAITVEYYQLDHRAANQHIREHRSTGQSDASSLHDTLSNLVDAKNARRIASGYLVTRSGQRAKIESIVQHIYPTEFDPPEVVPDLAGPVHADVRLMTNLTPTAFETRNTGLTIEVDPVIGNDGAFIDLNIATELVEHIGDRILGQNEARMTQPVFNTANDMTAITLKSGSWAFVGTHGPAPTMSELNSTGTDTGNRDERIIVLVRANLVEFNLETSEPSDPPTGPAVISTLAEYIEVGEADAARLLSSLSESGSSSALREELESRIESGSATLIETASVTTRSGQRAKSQSSSEWIYPTAQAPPDVPKELRGPIEKGNELITPLTYTSFETRNIGTSLEIDPVANANRLIVDVNIAPEIVSHVGETKYGQLESQTEIPIFGMLKTQTAVTVKGNDPLLVSVYMPIDKKSRKPNPDRRVFLFLSSTALQVD